MAKTKVTDKDLYELLEVLPSATEKEIKKAYRKKALKCHPDKNPDNPKAAELFHELSAALEILTDAKAKEAYDRTLKARELAKQRTKELDSKRRKFKEDLERREQQAKESGSVSRQKTISDEEKLQKEIDRLRKEGSQALREEQELIRQQIFKEQQGKFSYVSNVVKESINADVPRIKVRWSSQVVYDKEKLINVFSKYGKVNEIVILKKSALIEFEKQTEADIAFTAESCVTNNHLKLEWISKHKETSGSQISNPKPTFPSYHCVKAPNTNSLDKDAAMKSFNDFEAMVLGKLAEAAAKQKRLQAETSTETPADPHTVIQSDSSANNGNTVDT